MYSKIKLAIVGCGQWGLNHVKTAHKILNGNLKLVCDIDTTKENNVKKISKNIRFTSKLEDVLNSDEINSVIISSTADSHYDIAKECLFNNKHLLIEKPITLVSADSKDLVKIAKKRNLTLMVGHVLLYHPAILELKKYIKSGKIGKLQYIYSNRLNLGRIRSHENILWSFAPHDISIIQYFIESNPLHVDAKGAVFVQPNIEDTTITYLEYPNNIKAHIFVSWLHPFKEHRLVVIGDKGMIVFDDTVKTDKLKLYNKGFNCINGAIEKFDSEYIKLNYEDKPPLEEEQKHFFNCVINKKTPRTDGIHATSVLEILELAQKKLKVNP